jgi:hypothetical protein
MSHPTDRANTEFTPINLVMCPETAEQINGRGKSDVYFKSSAYGMISRPGRINHW